MSAEVFKLNDRSDVATIAGLFVAGLELCLSNNKCEELRREMVIPVAFPLAPPDLRIHGLSTK